MHAYGGVAIYAVYMHVYTPIHLYIRHAQSDMHTQYAVHTQYVYCILLQIQNVSRSNAAYGHHRCVSSFQRDLDCILPRYQVTMTLDKPCLLSSLKAYDATRLPGRSVLKAGKILAGSVIGAFKCDVGTVYAAPGTSASTII